MQGRIGAGKRVVAQAGGLTKFGMSEAQAFAVENQLGVIDEGHAAGMGKLLSTGGHEIDVRTLFKNQARGLNRVAEALDAGHAASFHATTIHEESVELNAPVRGQETAAAGVEGGVIFENGDGRLHAIESRPTASKNGVACFKRAAHP